MQPLSRLGIAQISLLLLCCSSTALAHAEAACESITFTAEVAAKEKFEKTIGGDLSFRLDPVGGGPKGQLDGWQMTIVSTRAPDADYIYPVNPPLRFNASQIFGAAYGMTVKESLRSVRRVRFLLHREDYDRLWPLVTNALWPYSAPHPDRAADEYVSTLQALRLGSLEVAVLSYEAGSGDSLRRMSVRAEITTPSEFALAPGLTARPTECPPAAAF